MNFLFLRGQVPQDRNPAEIVFEKIEEVDDVWTQLIYAMTGEDDSTELWYWGGYREEHFSKNFVERWVPDFESYNNDFIPDVIFCRGGFPEYHYVLKRWPNAFKIYYGAGIRFLPQEGFHDYDLILQDSKEQLSICREKFPDVNSSLFIKPAPDDLFYPMDIDKDFDIVFPANGAQSHIKGHEFVFGTAPEKYKILNLGNGGGPQAPPNIKRLRLLKSYMAEHLQRAKLGIVCCNNDYDSAPRVIPEMLACNIPIVCFDDIRFWGEKYITPETGILAERNPESFWNAVEFALKNLDQFSPAKYYKENLSLKIAANHILSLINANVK